MTTPTSSSSFVKHTFHFLLSLFLLLLNQTYSQSHSLVHDHEQKVLLNIKQYLQNTSFLNHWTPSSNSNHCSWKEIICTNGFVTGITLSEINITKTIPPFICNELKNLTHVDFSFNFIPGDFPTLFYNCSKLVYLDLSMNNFDGIIPNDIGNLSSYLQYLNLGSTNFHGGVPDGIGKLKELRELRIQYCLLNGTVSDEIGELLNLEFLDLSSNAVFPSWKLPLSLTKMKNLKVLYVYGSNLIDEIPERIEDMVSLEKLDLSDNGLTGEIPRGLFMLKNLSILYLYKNKLSGEIPSSVQALNLTSLDLAENKLVGKIPQDFGKLQKLTWLSLSINSLSGEIPESVGLLPSLVDFRVFSNKLSAGVSSWTNVIVFDASNNLLNGSIPQEITSLPKLTTLLLDQNQLNGPIPTNIISWKSLVTLNLSRNQLSGQIPDTIGKLPVLSQLDLSENEFSGEFPSQLPRLTNLNLSSNHLTGRIPSEFQNSGFARSFLANSGLCADTPMLNITLCHSGFRSESKGSSWSIGLIIILVMVTILLAFSAAFLIINVFKKRKQGLDNSWKLVSFQRPLK
ncbi:unnamed protein product [Lathyrus sativus]|nr:unnamed protein product [Lathyrus sativus]